MPFIDDADPMLARTAVSLANPEGLSAASDDNTHCWALYNCSSACYDTETPQNNCKCSSSLFVFFRNQKVACTGLTGVYKGMAPKLSQTCLNAALMFLFYEKLEVVIEAMLGLGGAH